MKAELKSFFALTAVTALIVPAAIALAAAPKLFYVAGGSMEPTLKVSERVRIQKNAYKNIHEVRRGNIIVYSRVVKASGRRIEAVQRVIGLPGDKVRLSGTRISINGRELPHTLLRRAGKVSIYRETNGKAVYAVKYGDNGAPAPEYSTVVKRGHLLCIGDNRDNASDSRDNGAVPFTSVIAKLVP